MAALSIRDLDDEVRERLRLRAAAHGRSMEAEVRAILTEAVADPGPRQDLFSTLVERLAVEGGLSLPPRQSLVPRPADLAG